jgi:hypothetical protein
MFRVKSLAVVPLGAQALPLEPALRKRLDAANAASPSFTIDTRSCAIHCPMLTV